MRRRVYQKKYIQILSISIAKKMKKQIKQVTNTNISCIIQRKNKFKMPKSKINNSNYINLYRIFDLYKDYSGFSIGEKEFKIQKVNLLKHYNEFVLIERNNILKSLGEIQAIPECQNEDLFYTSLEGEIVDNFSVLQNYLDGNCQQWDQMRARNTIQTAIGFQKYAEPNEIMNIKCQGRSRSNTMEEFEKFQGDHSTDPFQQEVKKGALIKTKQQKLNEAKRVKEEYASFITLTASDLESSNQLLDSQGKQKASEREEKIQGAIHGLCLLIQGICKILGIALPYPIKLNSKGFFIKDNAENQYPLWLKTPNQELTLKHQIQFENAIILLDKDIQFILYIHGFQLTLGSCNNQILNIFPLFEQKALGRSFIIENKKYPQKKKLQYQNKYNSDNEEDSEYELDQFEVLKLQNRQQSANEQLECLRNSQIGNSKRKNSERQSKASSQNESEWSEVTFDEEDVELIKKIKNINLQELIKDHLQQD